MKKITIGLLFFITATGCYSQQGKPLPTLSTNDYKTKAKNQKVIAWLLIGRGSIVLYATTIHGINHMFESNQKLGVPLGIGLTLMAGSVPFFVASHRNLRKSKAASTSFIIEGVPNFRVDSNTNTYYPALAIKISL